MSNDFSVNPMWNSGRVILVIRSYRRKYTRVSTASKSSRLFNHPLPLPRSESRNVGELINEPAALMM